MTEKLTIRSLFSFPYKTLALIHLERCLYPWEALDNIGDFIKDTIKKCDSTRFYSPSPDILIAKSAKIAPSASIKGPCIIDEEAEIRHGAFIRGNAVIGSGAVVGNSCEIKNSILFDKVQVPHFNYVGDSILGYASHMGAGAVTSNVKLDKTPVIIEKINTERKKSGAFLGDFVEVGCNSVLNPGTVIGRESVIYPLSGVRGYVPEKSIYKNGEIVKKI